MVRQIETDAALLEAFASSGREDAFQALVGRYGALVYGVCLRRLPIEQDAEDASQAVFLLLARKAGRLTHRTSLAGWLHHAAVNVCRNARRASIRREPVDQEAVSMHATSHDPDPGWNDLAPVLDEELDRLREPERAAVVLHHVEGLSKAEVAKRLGWSEGTVSSRLHRALGRLRGRLARRGVALSASALFALVSDNASAAAFPAGVGARLSEAAVLVASGKATLAKATSVSIASMAEKTATSMVTAKVVKAAAAALVVGVVGAGTVVYSGGGSPPGMTAEPIGKALRREAMEADASRRRMARHGAFRAEATDGIPGVGRLVRTAVPHGAAIAHDGDGVAPRGAVKPAPHRPGEAPAGAVEPGPAPQVYVTLFSLKHYEDFERATLDFAQVRLDGAKEGDRDLLYGREEGDPLTVRLQADDRGALFDLGERTWAQAPSSASLTKDAADGAGTITPKEGHLYFARILDGDTDVRVLFRVEALVPGDQVSISWMPVGESAPGPDPGEGRPADTASSPPRPPSMVRAGAARIDNWPKDHPRPFQILSGNGSMLNRHRYRSFATATYSFRYGVRDDPNNKLTLNDWCVQFGAGPLMRYDVFHVNMSGGDRSRLVDLGPLDWDAVEKTPVPALPVSDNREENRYPDRIPVVAGHMYLAHLVSVGWIGGPDGTRVRGRAHDFYALFRVESHDLNDRCTFTWRLINAPDTGAPPIARW